MKAFIAGFMTQRWTAASVDELISMKTKRYAYARLRRMLLAASGRDGGGCAALEVLVCAC